MTSLVDFFQNKWTVQWKHQGETIKANVAFAKVEEKVRR